jgi:hypothetical protein
MVSCNAGLRLKGQGLAKGHLAGHVAGCTAAVAESWDVVAAEEQLDRGSAWVEQ